MARRRPVYVVTLEVVDVDTGGWCDRCLLPSLVTVHLALIYPSGLITLGRQHGCTDCGWSG